MTNKKMNHQRMTIIDRKDCKRKAGAAWAGPWDVGTAGNHGDTD